MEMLKKLLFIHAASGGSTPVPTVEATATGNPATFTTDISRNLTGLTIPFTPKQSGSGDPSPENVRPITGFTGITVYRSGEDTSNPKTYTVSFGEAGTVYGGELDAVTGVLTVKWAGVSLDSLTYTHISVAQGDMFRTDTVNNCGLTTNKTDFFCSCYKPSTSSGRANLTISCSQNAKIDIIDSNYSDAQSFINSVKNQMVVFPLATNYTLNLSPAKVKTLIGENVLWSDTNGSNTIKYLKKE